MKHRSPAVAHALSAIALCVGLAFAVQVRAALPAAAKSGIAWQLASSEAEVERAFDLAKKSGKPLFLYWGAVWCPPCNQVKATLFSRADFVERSRAFVPVYVDGDRPGAQKVASRYRVSGYPTMILFKPDGTEVTRLPGEVDPQRYLLALNAGLDAQVPVKELVMRALARRQLTAEQWRLLAFYSWDTDEQQVLASAELPQRLAELAAAAPKDLASVRDRIAFKAIAARAQADKPGDARAADRQFIDRVLADPIASGELADLLAGYGERTVRWMASAGDDRKLLAAHWDIAIARLLEGGNLSRADQVDALDARVALWKMIDGGEKLNLERRQAVLKEIARIVSVTNDRYERQAVIPSAAHVLAEAGLVDDSDALLKAELPRAVAPYYHMLVLAGNAKRRGDTASALRWYEQAWRKSEGSATRIQWGTNYVGHLIELAPADTNRISRAATAVLGEIKSESFYGRSQRSLEKMAKRLGEWRSGDASRTAAVDKLKAQLTKTCAKLPSKDAARASCQKVFTSSAVA